MVKWSSIPFFRFALALIAGILFYIYSPYPVKYLHFFSISLFLYAVLYYSSFNQRLFHRLKPYLGFTGILTLFFFGALLTQLRDEKNDSNHLINFPEEIEFYQAIATESSEEREKTFRTRIRLEKIKTTEGWINAKGQILLYTPKLNYTPLKYGDQLLIKGSPKLTQGPANPFEFDYKNYLRFKQIHHTHFVHVTNFQLTGNNSPSLLLEGSIFIREKSNAILRKYIQGNNEFKIASALILGIRSTLDNDLKNAYSSTGTMHVLAVSGLHVGIVLGMLMMALNYLKYFSAGRIALPLILITALWIYAFITGFSASVLRAVVMFSLVILAQSLKRNTNIYNTLALSAFVLLCIDPFFIMDVGFQLSFLAVFGIVFFQSNVYSLITFKNFLLDKVWMLTSVSIAAQISTLPLTLYYFHQFPLNFIFSNMVAIPLSFGILYSGMLLLMLSWIPGLNLILGWITETGIKLMNYTIFMIEDIPFSVIKEIDLDLPEIVCLYLILFFITSFLFYKKINYLRASALILLCFTSIQTLEVIHQKKQKKFISFCIQGHTALGFIKGNHIIILADSSLIVDKQKQEYHIYPYLMQYGIGKVSFHNIKKSSVEISIHSADSLSIVCFQGKSFLIGPGSSFKNNSTNIKTDFTLSTAKKEKIIAFEFYL